MPILSHLCSQDHIPGREGATVLVVLWILGCRSSGMMKFTFLDLNQVSDLQCP